MEQKKYTLMEANGKKLIDSNDIEACRKAIEGTSVVIKYNESAVEEENHIGDAYVTS